MRKPDLEGTLAKAWKLPVEELRGKEGGRKEPDATLAHYLVEGPFHPFWNQWLVTVLHLRPLEGVGPPKLQAPEMTHEFLIISIDPDKTPLDPDNLPFPLPFLTPIDACVQFKGTDEEAIKVCHDAVRAIVAGHASPDQDFRSWWAKAIPQTLAHYRGEHLRADHH